MTAVRPSPRFNIIRKSSTRARPSQRTCRKLSVDSTNGVVSINVSEQSNRESVDAGFCGEPFADNGELLSSLSPMLFSMKLLGLYFHRRGPHRRRTDDPDVATTSTSSPSTSLRLYATVVLIITWINVFRVIFLFNSTDHFGTLLLMKIVVFAWFGLVAILQSAYYFASHTGQLLNVLITLPVTSDCVRGVRRTAVVLTVFAWSAIVVNGFISFLFFFITDGEYDFNLAPFVTYITVSEDKIVIARVIGSLLYFLPIPCSLFAQVMTQVLVYVFYHQFRKLNKNFGCALGKRGEFSGDLSVFRRRHIDKISRPTSTFDRIMEHELAPSTSPDFESHSQQGRRVCEAE